MSFTYDLRTDIGRLRLELGDTTENDGVRPSGGNLSDEELQVWLTEEGSVKGALAAAAEALGRQWAIIADLEVGERSEKLGSIADRWANRAAAVRAQLGGDTPGFSYQLQRSDGYDT